MPHQALTTLMQAAKANRLTAPKDGEFSTFAARDGVPIRYGVFGLSAAREAGRGTVMFVPGRSEFAEKFFEDMHIFVGLGFAAGAMDLRGQGLSYREVEDRDKHVVSSFDDYVGDLDQLITELEAAGAPRPYILMGHSAGSHAIFRFLHAHPGRVERAITVAPMIDINSGNVPRWITNRLPKLMRLLARGHRYVPGHGPYTAEPVGWQNKLTHDTERWQDEHHLIAENPDLRCGGATFTWIAAALGSIARLRAPGFAEAIKTPVLMLQAGDEQIVDNAASSAFAARLTNCRLEVIDGAAHEILKETDARRAELWAHICDWLSLSAE